MNAITTVKLTDDQTQQILSLRRQGSTLISIAEQIGISPQRVMNCCKKAGITSSRHPNLKQEEIDRICTLRERNWSLAAIADELNLSVGSVSYHLVKTGTFPKKVRPITAVPLQPHICVRNGRPVRKFTQDEDSRLLLLSAEGNNISHIAKELNRPHNSIIGRLMTLANREARQEG